MMLLCLFVAVVQSALIVPGKAPVPLFGLQKNMLVSSRGNTHISELEHVNAVGTTKLSYNVTVAPTVQRLEDLPVEAIDCGDSETTIVIHQSHHAKFAVGTILTGHRHFGCKYQSGAPKTMMKRIVAVKNYTNTVKLITVDANFHEVFEHASVSFSTNKVPQSTVSPLLHPESPKPVRNQVVVKRDVFSWIHRVWQGAVNLIQEISTVVADVYTFGKDFLTGDTQYSDSWVLASLDYNFDSNNNYVINETISISGQVACTNCYVHGSVTLFFSLDIQSYSLQQMHILLQGLLAVGIGGYITGTSDPNGEISVGTITLPDLDFVLAGIPIVIHTTMPISVGFDMPMQLDASLNLGTLASGNLTLGFVYYDGGFHTVKDWAYTYNGNWGNAININFDAQLQVYMVATCIVAIDYIGGPALGIKPFVEFAINASYGNTNPNCPISIAGSFGVFATISASIDITVLGQTVFNKNWGPFTIYSAKKPILSRCFGAGGSLAGGSVTDDGFLNAVPGSSYLATWSTVDPTCAYLNNTLSMQIIDIQYDVDGNVVDVDFYGSVNSFKDDGTACVTQTYYSLLNYGTGDVTFQPSQDTYFSECEGGGEGFDIEFHGSGNVNGWTVLDDSNCYQLTMALVEN